MQNTLKSIALETKKSKAEAPNSPQWVLYWMVWSLLDGIGGWIYIFRPGWKAIWEIWKVVALVILGGPWFGRASLVRNLHGGTDEQRPPGQSKELLEAGGERRPRFNKETER